MSDATVGRVEFGPRRCECGSEMRDGGAAGWYCLKGWECRAPLLVAPFKSDKQRTAELEAEVARLMEYLGHVALACVVSDVSEAYHWAYKAITHDFQGSASEQAGAMRAAIDAAMERKA